MANRNKPSYGDLERENRAFFLAAGNACGGLNRAIELLETIYLTGHLCPDMAKHLRFLRRVNCMAQREIAGVLGKNLDDVLNGGTHQ